MNYSVFKMNNKDSTGHSNTIFSISTISMKILDILKQRPTLFSLGHNWDEKQENCRSGGSVSKDSWSCGKQKTSWGNMPQQAINK